MDITKLPVSELMEDLRASIKDAELCATVLSFGVEEVYGCTPTRERLSGNKEIVRVIVKELERRCVDMDEDLLVYLSGELKPLGASDDAQQSASKG